MASMKSTEERLVAACLQKDEKAYRELYERYAPKLFGICHRYCKTSAAAEDVLHEGFIKIFESLDKLREVNSLGSWMSAIMVRTAINSYHRERPVASEAAQDEQMLGSQYDGEEIYDQIDIEYILEAISELPPQYRAAFNLCEIDGYSYPEASKIMKVTESTVRTNLFRAKKILANKLKHMVE